MPSVLVVPSTTTGALVLDKTPPTKFSDSEGKVDKAADELIEATPVTTTPSTTTDTTAQSVKQEKVSSEDSAKSTGDVSSTLDNGSIIADQLLKRVETTTLVPMAITTGGPKSVVLDSPLVSMSTDSSKDSIQQTSPMPSTTLRPSTTTETTTTSVPSQSKVNDSPFKNFLNRADNFIERNLVSLKKLLTK